jgi:hypothetical protein
MRHYADDAFPPQALRLEHLDMMNLTHWCRREPTLEDILSDSIVRDVMEADGVDPHELADMLRDIGRVLSREMARAS